MSVCKPVIGSKRVCEYSERPNWRKRSCNGGGNYNKVDSYSSSEKDDSEDEQKCYRSEQARAKRRASSRMSFSLNLDINSELNRAVSMYSDDEDPATDGSELRDIDCKILSRCTGGRKFMQISDSSSCGSKKKLIPESDSVARSRCFEYLVSSIDEAWARYCDATTSTEDHVFRCATPASLINDEDEYFDNSTDFTDYEDGDFNDVTNFKRNSSVARFNSIQASVPSVEYDSQGRLRALKDRLTKAKYFLQDLVDSNDSHDVSSFWKRWDMIKYATIELVEDDDGDEVVENTIDELEDGRLFMN